MRIEEFMIPVKELEDKILEQNCILVQILEILKGKNSWRLSGITDAKKRIEKYSREMCDAKTADNTELIRSLRNKIENAKRTLETLQNDEVQFNGISKAFANCAKEFSAMKLQALTLRTHINSELCGGSGLNTKVVVGKKEVVHVDEPLTDDGFNEILKQLSKTQIAFNRMQIVVDALHAFPSTIESFRSKYNKLTDRIGKLNKSTPEYETSCAMRDKIGRHIKIIEKRAGALLKTYGESTKLVLNRTFGLTEQMNLAVTQGHLRKVARESLPPINIVVGNIRSHYNGEK